MINLHDTQDGAGIARSSIYSSLGSQEWTPGGHVQNLIYTET